MFFEPAALEIPDFAAHDCVYPVPVEQRPGELSAAEFAEKYANQCVLLRSAAANSRALSHWNDRFFHTFGTDLVTVRSCQIYNGLIGWTARIPLRTFMDLVKVAPGMYLAEWYFFAKHPKHLRDVIDSFPEYLLDDWLELIPPGWALGTESRNSIFWGGAGTYTACHWDTMATQVWNATIRGVKRWLVFDASGIPGRTMRMGAAQMLMSAGLMNSAACLTPAGLLRWASAPVAGVRAPKFFTVDVHPGDVLYLPPRWGHQVHNLGETLACSRYYANGMNIERFLGTLEGGAPPVAIWIVRELLRSPRRRAMLRRGVLRDVLASRASSKIFHAVLRQTRMYAPTTHYLTSV